MDAECFGKMCGQLDAGLSVQHCAFMGKPELKRIPRGGSGGIRRKSQNRKNEEG
jgi:hypothetical protein